MRAPAPVATAAVAVCAGALGLAACGAGAAHSKLPGRTVVSGLASPRVCTAGRDALAAYGWPVRPFDRPHAIRGAFGDPRTVERSIDRIDGPRSRGSFRFHNGIDVVAADGTRVYPVASGIALVRHRYEVSVHADHNRVFQYWHIAPRVHSGRRVIAAKTVLGTVQKGQHHVHLGEIDDLRVVNPLAPGHLGPFSDDQVPVVRDLVVRDPQGASVALDRLSGKLALIADAADEQPVRFWGPWFGKPVTPALLRWRLVSAAGAVVRPWRTAADFRLREPAPSKFWAVYAPGTYQNFPVLDDRFDWGRPGRYLFRLTHDLIDTRNLPNGGYDVEVEATDICGNHAELRQPVAVENPPPALPRIGK